MRNQIIFSIVTLSAAAGFTTCRSPASAAETRIDPAEKKIPLSLHAGRYDRCDVFVSVLIDAGKARSVFVEYADGTLGRAQLADPGMLNALWRGKGKKELHFVSTENGERGDGQRRRRAFRKPGRRADLRLERRAASEPPRFLRAVPSGPFGPDRRRIAVRAECRNPL